MSDIDPKTQAEIWSKQQKIKYTKTREQEDLDRAHNLCKELAVRCANAEAEVRYLQDKYVNLKEQNMNPVLERMHKNRKAGKGVRLSPAEISELFLVMEKYKKLITLCEEYKSELTNTVPDYLYRNNIVQRIMRHLDEIL